MERSADQYFAIIPESVLYADISSNAVRVYGVLRRHADKDDGTCHPGRTRIAKLANIHERSVDRALRELESIGAIEVMHRVDPDNPKQFLSNQYRVLTPSADVTTPRAGVTTPLALVSPPPRAGVAVTRVIEPESENQRTYDQLAVDQAFDTFWNTYPRKIARKKCKQWWNRHHQHANKILDSLNEWCQYWEQTISDNRYIPHPYTWLNQERWDDPPPATSNTRTDIVLAVLDSINQQPALEAHNDPF